MTKENNDQVIMPGLETATLWVIGRHDTNYNKKSWQNQVKIFLIMLNWSVGKKWKFVILKFTYRKTVRVIAFIDKMAEWLRRWTDNPLGSASVGRNPIFVVFLFGSVVKWIAICSLNSANKVQISEKKTVIFKTLATTFFEIKKKNK